MWVWGPNTVPLACPHSEQRRPARAHAVGAVLGPHAHTDRTRDTRVAEPRLPAPEDGQPGERQRLTPDAPHNGGRPPPPGTAPPPPPRHAAPTGHASQGNSVGPPHPHTHAHSTWVAGPNSPPSGRAAGGGTAPDLRRPSQWWEAPPPGTPFRHPHSEQRRPAGAHAVGLVLGPHARTDRTRDTRVAEPWLPAPEDGRPGEGQRLTPDAPHNGGRPPPPGTAPHHPRSTQHPQGMWRKVVPGGRAFYHCEGRLRSGAVPPPTARPLGGLLGSATHVLWARVCGRRGPTLSPWPAYPVGAACGEAGGGAVPGGVACTIVRGVWCQALSLPRPPVLWRGQPGFCDPCVPGAVGAGVGTQHRPHSVCTCGLALLAVGVAEGRPRGGCLPPL